MKVVIVGPYRDGTGYSNAIIEYAKALDRVGVDVVLRSAKMTPTNGEIDQTIQRLESGDLNNVDAVWQYNLPNVFSRNDSVLNIGGFAYETSGYPNTNWVDHLELMDLIIVPCRFQKEITIQEDWIRDKTQVVHIPTEKAKYNESNRKRLDLGLSLDTIRFYTISEYTRRKNLPALLAAYYSKFSSNDNVVLIIKSHVPNRDADYARHVITDLAKEIKSGIRRFNNEILYPKVVLITDYLTNEQIYDLHHTGTFFVSASHGEAWSHPTIDAMFFGKMPIVPDYGAFMDYVEDGVTGIRVPVVETTALGVSGAPDGLYTADELWANVNIDNLGDAMRFAYDNKKQIWEKGISENCTKFVEENLNYDVIGERLASVIKEALDAK